jgi:hypothetical protein
MLIPTAAPRIARPIGVYRRAKQFDSGRSDPNNTVRDLTYSAGVLQALAT